MDASLLPRRYTFVERASRRVVLALDRLTGHPVALKAAHLVAGPGIPGGDGAVEIAREAEILAGLAHPGFPRFVDFGFLADGRAFFAMEKAEGERPVGPLETSELAILIDGLCEALSLLHSRGLVHRDLKPDNVRFDPATGRVMLLDVGLATPPGRVRDARGTRGFLAPELLERGVIDARADLYSLGALVYECATGRPAFSGAVSEMLIAQRAGRFVPVTRLRPDLPEQLAFEIARLLDPDPGRRPASADEAREKLLASLGTAELTRLLCPELVGAGPELAALERGADAALRSGEACRVVVSGIAGSGRGRLLEEWRTRVALSGRAMLIRRVNAGAPHPLADLAADLGLLLDADVNVSVTECHETDPATGGAIVAEAVAAVTGALAALAGCDWRRAPLVIAFEGCEQASVAVAGDLIAFARSVRGPVMVLLATDSGTGAFAPRGGDLALSLAPLPTSRALELVASAIRGDVSPEIEAHALMGGRMPGEILATLEGMGLGRRAASWRELNSFHPAMGMADGELAGEPPSETVLAMSDPVAAMMLAAERALEAIRGDQVTSARELVRAGLSRCDEAASTRERHHAEAILRGVAAALAASGGQPSESIAQREMAIECARRSEDGLNKGRALLELARLRRGSGDEAAAQSLLAAALIAVEAGSTDSIPDGEVTLASLLHEVLAEAASLELKRGNLDKCAEFLSREDAAASSSACPDLGVARLALVRARLLALRRDESASDAFAMAAAALSSLGAHDEAAVALSDCARWRETMGDLQGALEAWTECLTTADGSGDATTVAGARDALAALHLRAGRPADAAEHARAAARAWANAGDETARAQSVLAAARSALRAGQVSAAVADMQEAVRLAGDDTPRERRAELLSEVGIAQLAAAEHAEALACCEEALALATEAGDRIGQAKASCALGLIHGAFGSTREGVRWCRRALDLTEDMPGATRARARLELGQLFVREGHLVVAERAIRQAMDEARAAGDVALTARAALRLGCVQRLVGQHALVDATLREGHSLARSVGDRLVEITAMRELGASNCELGDPSEGLRLLDESLEAAVVAGWYAELPSTHEALARAHLRLALRLRTPTGVVVDRQRLEIARAHVEKGLDLTVTTGRMADRAALLVLSASASEMTGDPRVALATADEAHRLALETGDLLVASRARLVRGEALLASREFGVALAEARIALEAVSRSGAVDETWRAHALLARVQGAWGMPEREVAATHAAAEILRRIASSLAPPVASAYLADPERQSALMASAGDAVRARRSIASELVSERLGGRVDTEDLVEALIVARRLAEERGMDLERTRERMRRANVRRRVLARAAAALTRARAVSDLAASPGDRRGDAARVLSGLARAWGAEAVVLAESQGGIARIHATHGEWPLGAEGLATMQRAVDSGAPRRRRRASRGAGGESEVVMPLLMDGHVVGALLVRLRPASGSISRGDFALLEALAPMLAMIVMSAAREPEPVATG